MIVTDDHYPSPERTIPAPANAFRGTRLEAPAPRGGIFQLADTFRETIAADSCPRSAVRYSFILRAHLSFLGTQQAMDETA